MVKKKQIAQEKLEIKEDHSLQNIISIQLSSKFADYAYHVQCFKQMITVFKTNRLTSFETVGLNKISKCQQSWVFFNQQCEYGTIFNVKIYAWQ